ncbi:MAG: hypothetical protein K6A14_03860, partial [Erysipelotrichaceae bacterium]|nr:hypothetical protein [Erysipelotrichaceae bacterium]
MNIEFEKMERQLRRRQKIKKVLTYGLLVIWAVCVIFPFYWMILTSFKSYGSYTSEYVPKFFTLSPTIENYIEVFTA